MDNRKIVQNILHLLLQKIQNESEKKNSSSIKLCLLTFALAELVSAKASYPAMF